MSNVTPSESASSQQPDPEVPDQDLPAKPDSSTDEPPHKRNWHHIPGTRVRTSTAALAVAFIVCVILYGYTSQRYGVVSPPPPPPPRTTTEVTPTTTYSESSVPSTTETSAGTSAPSISPDDEQNPSLLPGEASTTTTTDGVTPPGRNFAPQTTTLPSVP